MAELADALDSKLHFSRFLGVARRCFNRPRNKYPCGFSAVLQLWQSDGQKCAQCSTKCSTRTRQTFSRTVLESRQIHQRRAVLHRSPAVASALVGCVCGTTPPCVVTSRAAARLAHGRGRSSTHHVSRQHVFPAMRGFRLPSYRHTLIFLFDMIHVVRCYERIGVANGLSTASCDSRRKAAVCTLFRALWNNASSLN